MRLMIVAIIVLGGMVPAARDHEGFSFLANIHNDGENYVGRIILIIDPKPRPGTHCGCAYDIRSCVIIDPGGGPAFVTVCGIEQTLAVSVGDRFNIDTQTVCDGRLDLTISPH